MQAAQDPPGPPRPNRDHLGYGSKLAFPDACACCMGPAEVRVDTDQVMTGSRRVSWFSFPYCRKCRWHMTWSGRFKTGVVDKLGWLFWGGGAVGGVALGLKSGDGGNQQANAAVYALLLSTAGYLLCMALVALLGLAIARRNPTCTCRGAAVRIRRGKGVWHFRFTNPQFEDVFRGMNRGF